MIIRNHCKRDGYGTYFVRYDIRVINYYYCYSYSICVKCLLNECLWYYSHCTRRITINVGSMLLQTTFTLKLVEKICTTWVQMIYSLLFSLFVFRKTSTKILYMTLLDKDLLSYLVNIGLLLSSLVSSCSTTAIINHTHTHLCICYNIHVNCNERIMANM